MEGIEYIGNGANVKRIQCGLYMKGATGCICSLEVDLGALVLERSRDIKLDALPWRTNRQRGGEGRLEYLSAFVSSCVPEDYGKLQSRERQDKEEEERGRKRKGNKQSVP